MPGGETADEPDLEVRILSPSEWMILRDLRLEALRDAPDAFESTVESEALLQEADWLQRIGRRAVAFVSGQPVGLVGWSPERSGDRDTELISMWVRPNLRGTPTAARLVQFAKDVARSRDGHLDLAVRTDNIRARRFYEKCGFVQTRQEIGQRSGKPLVWMRLGDR
jgi:ribosomal protein S18 acetylase RimI-like enzyme